MRKHLRQDIVAALAALLKDMAAEAFSQADGWAAVEPIWHRHLYSIGRGKRLPDTDIEDMIQEAFVAILARWECHRLLAPGRLFALSLKIMRDKVVDEIRRRDRRRAVRLEALPFEPAADGYGEIFSAEDMEEWNKWALARVVELKRCNKRYYELLYAHYVEGRSCKELGIRAGCSVDAVKSLLRRAREEVRRLAAKHPLG